MSGKKLKAVDEVKCIGAIVTGEESTQEILFSTARITVVLTKLKTIWNCRIIALRLKFRLIRNSVISISCMPVGSRLLWKIWRGRYRLRQWDAFADCLASHIETTSVAKKRSRIRQTSENMTTNLERWRTGTPYYRKGVPKPFSRAPCGDGGQAHRREDGRRTSQVTLDRPEAERRCDAVRRRAEGMEELVRRSSVAPTRSKDYWMTNGSSHIIWRDDVER